MKNERIDPRGTNDLGSYIGNNEVYDTSNIIGKSQVHIEDEETLAEHFANIGLNWGRG